MQPSDVDKAVDLIRAAEASALRSLDDVVTALRYEEGVDRRYMAIGRTQIELGFMAVYRSVGLSAALAAAVKAPVETGWVLERADSPTEAPLYYCPRVHGEQWTLHADDALRCDREIDAAQLGVALGIAVRVCEHRWG